MRCCADCGSGIGESKRARGMEEWAHGKVTILCKIPWHVIGALPDTIVLSGVERSAGVEKPGIKSGDRWGPKRDGDGPLESDEIGHSADSEICHEVHVTGMNLVNEGAPVGDCAPVRIEDAEIERRIT